MEEIAETLLKGIWGVVRFVLWQILFQIVLFNIGRVFLLVITLGKYPRFKHIEKDSEKIALLGFFLVIIAWLAIAINNNINT